MKRAEVLKQARRAGIKVQRAKPRLQMADLFRALAVGETLTMPFTHAQAPYVWARLVGIKVRCHVKKRSKNRVLIEVERINNV